MNTLNTQTIKVTRNGKIEWAHMSRQTLVRSLYALSNGWDAFLVKTGRVEPDL